MFSVVDIESGEAKKKTDRVSSGSSLDYSQKPCADGKESSGSAPGPVTEKSDRCRPRRTTRPILLQPLQNDSEEVVLADEKLYFDRGPMAASLRFVTTPTADTAGTTLVLHTPQQQYIFGNVAEGTQRAASQMGVRLVKAQDFFITGRTEWSNMGGLLGMILSLADSASTAYQTSMETYRAKQSQARLEPQAPSLNIRGPSNIKQLLATSRRFIFRKGVPLTVTEFKDTIPTKDEKDTIPPTWQDKNIRVWAMPLQSSDPVLDSQGESALEWKRDNYEHFFNNFEEFKAPQSESADAREVRYDQIRTAVIKHMFDSDWRFDTLVEKHISEVEMPAALFVRNPVTNHLESYQGPKPGGAEPLPDITVLTRTPWPGALIHELPPTGPASESISYIVRTHPMRGKFDPKRALELGVKRGPDFKILADGSSVQSASGETVTPDMVLGPERPGQGFAMLDVPSVDYLDSVVKREELMSSDIMQGVEACIWILGPGVSSDPIFQNIVQKLDQVKHIVSSVDHCPNRLSLGSVAGQTIRLGQIDAERYHVPFHDDTTIPQRTLRGTTAAVRPLSGAMVAQMGLKMTIMPNFSIQEDQQVPLLDIGAIRKETSQEILDLAAAARDSLESDKDALQAWMQKVPRPDTEIITLGTGSALPSKYRNVSATLVRVPGVGNYLLDCGENTLGQLQRVFSPDELTAVLRDLRVIWISHLHADHHLGTTSVIKAWYNVVHTNVPANTPPTMSSMSTVASMYGLSVISHEGMLRWLKEYSTVEDFGYSRILPLQIAPAAIGTDSGSFLELCPFPNTRSFEDEYVLKQEDYATVLGLTDIQACLVSHCRGAMAVSMTFPRLPSEPGPLKVSYSGDCRPSLKFVDIGQNTSVLIHEATFDDELIGDARAKKHSTTSEALGIGAKMGAKAVVLTHFSQRYQKIPVLQTVDNGEQEDPMLELKEAQDAPDEAMEEDEADADMDAPMENAVKVSTTEAAQTHSHSQPHLHHSGTSTESNEQVIKVHAKDMKVAIAFDYMRVKISEIAQLEKFTHALSKLFADPDADLDPDEQWKNEEGEGEKNENGKTKSPTKGGGQKKKAKRNN
ncbi:hypothetical protein BCR34DRAFT_586568 [Clohesyomyces aquaticus]|uniref:ribonuclease Z n=1 Tax=Clohesyomyces aquaticus TaxID=1231657 RepID=A0A1Y1ZT70_9PLEO|nr:hypothetical protein BCR34DRAFT_586568 [Clohesyomyces aquaticus]